MNLFTWRVRTMLSALVLLSWSATPVAAVDLTGTWEGKAVCAGFFDGRKVRDIFAAPVTITQTGSDLNMEFAGVRYNGGIIDDSTKPNEKGQGAFIACSADGSPLADYNESGHLKVQIKGNKASFTATSVFHTAAGGSLVTVETCKYNFKRTSTINPDVPECD